MTKTWYPVIDYGSCIECGACNDMCAHGVYDEGRKPVPVVVFPEGCVQGCRGCAELCPAGAIAYVGDGGDCDCDCGSGSGCGK